MDWFVVADLIVSLGVYFALEVTPALYVLGFQAVYVFWGIFHEFDEVTWLFKSTWLLTRFVYHCNNLENLVIVGSDGYELTNYLWIDGFAATITYFGTFIGQMVHERFRSRGKNVKTQSYNK